MKKRTPEQLQEEARSKWKLWRLVMSEKFSYDTVFNGMTMDEVDEANAALDLYEEAIERANKR